jgi:acyl-CoA synthetase (AMP-forming)/AMP-acid ligase II
MAFMAKHTFLFNFAAMLEAIAEVDRERPAVETMGGSITYGELNQLSNTFADLLKSKKYNKNDRVGLFCKNSVQWIAAFYGCFKAGLTPIGIHPKYTAEEVKHIVETAGIQALLVGSDTMSTALKVQKSAQHLDLIEIQSVEKLTSINISDYSDDDWYVAFTGGTTGLPKGVVWDQNELLYAAMNQMRGNKPFNSVKEVAKEVQESDFQMKVGLFSSLSHSGAQWTMGSVLVGGGCLCLFTGSSFKPDEVCSFIEQTRLQALPLMGDAMAQPLAKFLKESSDIFDLSSVFVIHNGAAPISPSVVTLLKTFFPASIFYDTYGSSEGGIVGSRSMDDDSFTSLNAFVINENDRIADEGQLGRIVKVGHHPIGYLVNNKIEENLFIEVDGTKCLVTGDWGLLDNGNIVLKGRGSSVINTGGEKVFPGEVEQTIKLNEDVLDVCVVGSPSPRWGSQVVALIKKNKNMTRSEDRLVEELKKICHSGLAPFKNPKHYIFVDEIPRTELGKIDYNKSEKMCEKLIGGQKS